MKTFALTFALIITCFFHTNAQSITGVWRGKVTRGIKNYNLELKLIRSGDSLSGTSYYYHSPTNYSRFKVKGYYDVSGDIVWWDKELVENKGGKMTVANSTPFQFAADFNCPGNDIMKLDGVADKKGDEGKDHEVHLSKMEEPIFKDEWDHVIEDFPYYASVPDYIDSIDRGYALERPVKLPAKEQEKAVAVVKTAPPVAAAQEKPAASDKTTPPATTKTEPPVALEKSDPPPVRQPEKKATQKTEAPPVVFAPKADIPATLKAPKSIEEKFVERKKILVTEIPVVGDSIKLNFYDHGEIDGDSISLFLNGKLIYQHVLLKASPFQFTIAVSDLQNENELIMVAENLGSIPPNTSLMIVWVNGVRHEARLESSENTSAMINFKKQNTGRPPDAVRN
ncbi:MAG TPA: hypothetical protein VLA58_08310 [Chitinophagaceae bacterium]|nr:hypothetical protein [Chitinophagaceae bacterium]